MEASPAWSADAWLDAIEATPADELPPIWTWEHVSARLVEAADVTLRERMTRIGPKPAASARLEYLHTKEEVDEAVRFALTEHMPSRRALPTKAELARRDETLVWVATYVEDDAEIRACVQNGADWEARGWDVGEEAARGYVKKSKFHMKRMAGLKQIADGLHAAGVPVT